MLLRQVPSSAGLFGTVKKTRSLLSLTAPSLRSLRITIVPIPSQKVKVFAVLRRWCCRCLKKARCAERCVSIALLATEHRVIRLFITTKKRCERRVPIILRSIQSERVFRSVEQVAMPARAWPMRRDFCRRRCDPKKWPSLPCLPSPSCVRSTLQP